MSSSHINPTQVSETQPSSSPLQLTVLRAQSLPRLKTLLGWKKPRFYATVIYGGRTWQTRSVRGVAQRVEWNENIDFIVEPRSRITITLNVKMSMRKDILVGKQEITCEPQHEIDLVFGNDGGHSTEATTLFLTITESANRNSSMNVAVNTLSPTTADLDNPAAEGGVTRIDVQLNSETMPSLIAATSRPPLSRTGALPVESDTPSEPPVVASQPEMSRTALLRAEQAITNVNTIKTWKSAVTNIKWVMDTVTPIAALNPFAKLAWSLLSKIPKTLLKQVERDLNIETLLEAIRDVFEFAEDADVLRNIMPESRQATILEEMLECVSKCAEFIRSYAEDVQVGKRALKYIVGQVDGEIEQYRTDLVRLQTSFLARATVTTEITVVEAELNARIREMPYKGGWRFNDKRCLPGTRKGFLDYIIKWVENPESERALVLLGQAGTGKSSIAHEIARHFDDKCLGSYFAFLRKEQSKDEAYQLFTTLARDLSDRNPAFKHALGRVIKDRSSLCGSRDYCTLFQSLLIEPLKTVPLRSPVLVVIDALDESGATIDKNGLHTFLAQCLIDLPPVFRILITSRSENGIEPAFANAKSVGILHMDDPQLAANTERDIGVYLQSELPEDVFKDHGGQLAKAADGLFQWAVIASGFIHSRGILGLSKKESVQRLLGHPQGRNDKGLLDNLYKEVLKEYIKSHEAQIVFRSVMGQLLAAIEPLSINSLIDLRQHAEDDPEDSDRVLGILGYLGSLLSNVTSSDQTRPIVPLHASFRDFLTCKKSDVFYVDLGDAHRQLAHSCPTLMLDSLKFNICKLESSHLANSDVPDLKSRIAKYIPPALSYACIYWNDHLGHVSFERELFQKLRSLLETKFLFWLEILSVKNRVGVASLALSSLSMWLQPVRSHTEVKNLLALVNDASAFMRYFGMPMARSAPHIYISALPFAPASSEILKQYIQQFPRTLTLERGQLSHWPPLEMTIHAHSEYVYSVVFSPDGQRIASGSHDGAIRVWDATTGQIVAGPFTGHAYPVRSVAFSPDGQRIASSSDDHTIRVWDATTGQVVAGPFTGHTDSVRSVAFSPDGKHIASGSEDHTICVWDATTGQIVAGPFTGHTYYSVTSVAFSPDGQRIASGSYDATIRVWDATTGQIVAGPFTGHTYSVTSVAFSPDGQHITSGSEDCTIRVWDATTGQVVAGPFTGHTNWVTSVAFSPDGQRIASGSTDCTIRVWDATTGQVVAGPFTGHISWVRSVAFSPDGQRIASGSDDHTIRVWDATTGQVVAGSFTGHTNTVTSVAFSPDKQRIASGSHDHTIRVWNATTGRIIAGPFTGHTNWVSSVAFSPNGQCIASGSDDCTIRVWDATTGQIVAGPFTGYTGFVTSVAFSPDGQRIASGLDDRTIRVWDATTEQVVAGPFTGHTHSVRSVAFSPDGQRIASGSDDCTIRVWDATTGQIIADPFIGHTDWVRSVAFSPDGKHIASSSDDHTICVWDATTGQIVAGPFTGHTDWVRSVALSPDGQHIASGSRDRTIRVWDATTGQVVAGPFTGHTNWVRSVAFSPNGQHIASGSDDHTIRVWDATTGQIIEGPFADPATSVAFSPDRHHAASTSDSAIHAEKVIGEDIKIHFTDQSLIDSDGWIYGDEGELLLWIPELHRPCLHRPSTVWIAGQHETRLDLSKFVHGSNWATVHDHNLFQKNQL